MALFASGTNKFNFNILIDSYSLSFDITVNKIIRIIPERIITIKNKFLYNSRVKCMPTTAHPHYRLN